MPDQELRIDKFLWATRVFKTRTIAAEACSKGQVTINDMPVKPSHHVRVDEIIVVRKQPVVHTYLVLQLLHNRLSAEKVKEYILETTPNEEFRKLDLARLQKNALRDKGAGRPTKRDRRQIDRMQEKNKKL
jgi:ribosome-associated heat shock protein Hsp15